MRYIMVIGDMACVWAAVVQFCELGVNRMNCWIFYSSFRWWDEVRGHGDQVDLADMRGRRTGALVAWDATSKQIKRPHRASKQQGGLGKRNGRIAKRREGGTWPGWICDLRPKRQKQKTGTRPVLSTCTRGAWGQSG